MPEFVFVARTHSVPAGTAITIDVDDDLSIALAHVEGGGFYAIDNICTHDGGPLGDCDLEGQFSIECPRHGALFDVRTGAATLPAIEPVKTYPVRVVGDQIQVEIP